MLCARREGLELVWKLYLAVSVNWGSDLGLLIIWGMRSTRSPCLLEVLAEKGLQMA